MLWTPNIASYLWACKGDWCCVIGSSQGRRTELNRYFSSGMRSHHQLCKQTKKAKVGGGNQYFFWVSSFFVLCINSVDVYLINVFHCTHSPLSMHGLLRLIKCTAVNSIQWQSQHVYSPETNNVVLLTAKKEAKIGFLKYQWKAYDFYFW